MRTISMGEIILMLLMGYLIGSCNFAIIYSKLFKKDDIRRYGSGNAGATNILRTYGKGPAAAVFLLDVMKGVVAALIARAFYPHTDVCACVAAFGAILGHNYPCYYDFKGGKGVATSFATLLVLDWRLALAALGTFLIVVLISRYVSLGSAFGAVAAVALAAVLRFGPSFAGGPVSNALFIYTACAALLCLLRHHANFKRIRAGKENKLGKKK